MSGPGHNSKTSFAQGQLRSLVERIERLNEELDAINSDKKEFYAEAKANGFDTKIIKKVVALRKRDITERQEEEAILDLYMSALGMIPADDGINDQNDPANEAPHGSVNGGDDVSTHVGAADAKPSDPSCKPGEPSPRGETETGEACAPLPTTDSAVADHSPPAPLAAADEAAGGIVSRPPAVKSPEPPDAGEIPEFMRRTK